LKAILRAFYKKAPLCVLCDLCGKKNKKRHQMLRALKALVVKKPGRGTFIGNMVE